jgi:multicomponent Na+:H+ antiporter subunit A
MLAATLAPFVLGVCAPMVRRVAGDYTGWVLAVLPAALTVYFAQFLGPVAAGETLSFSTEWIPALGIALSFYVDGLSLLFALLISFIGTFIVLYAGAYLKGHADLGRFLMFLLMFMGSMLGLVLSDNVVTLFVFWELTSITSFLLIGFNHDKARSRRAALQALVVTGGGGLALLAGLLLMAQAGGAMELSTLLADGDVLREHPWYLAMLILVLCGAFTKSAQVPFHFWLPNAMEAPTPVSAYLHSATMVKAGVYLLARMNPGLGGTEVWHVVLMVFGGATLVAGALLALRNTDLKLMLAQTTVASLGLLVFLIGIGEDYAIQAAMAYLFAHSMFKGALFMVAGSVDHGTGTRDLHRLSGLGRIMPFTATAGALAALSMSGLPPFFGFIAKEWVYKGTLDGSLPLVLTAVAITGNALMFAVAFLVGFKPFFGKPGDTPHKPHEGSLGLWIGALTLAALSLFFGLFSDISESLFVGPAAIAVAGKAMAVDLYLWGGFKAPVVASIITVAFGALLFWQGRRASDALARLIDPLWGPDKGYDQFMDAIVALARGVSGVLQTGILRRYMLVTFLVLAAAVVLPQLFDGIGITFQTPPVDLLVWSVALLTLGGGLAVVIIRSRLIAIMSMGIMGTGVAFVFLLFGAPDLTFTQLMVETLSVVILALVITRLPVFGTDHRGPLQVTRDAVIGVAVGGALTALLLTITGSPLDIGLSTYFGERSYTEAFGRNIVNVILVDFRALDTLGEIAVVTIAGVSVLGLLAFRRRGSTGESIGSEGEKTP